MDSPDSVSSRMQPKYVTFVYVCYLYIEYLEGLLF